MPFEERFTQDVGGSFWNGTRVFIPARRRPMLRVEACDFRRLRVVLGQRSLLWARVDHGHYGYHFLRASGAAESLNVLPSFSFQRCRDMAAMAEPGSSQWHQVWAKVFAQALCESENTTLYSTPMIVGTSTRLWPTFADPARGLLLPMSDYSDWDSIPLIGATGWVSPPPMPLRSWSPQQSGRVKAFRKLAKEHLLPPVLLLWVSGLQRYVILDGHDRVLASGLEGKPVPWLGLSGLRSEVVPVDPVRLAAIERSVAQSLEAAQNAKLSTSRHISVEQANRLLVKSHDTTPHEYVVTRAWPVNGRSDAWTNQVREELTHQQLQEGELLQDSM
jgi:hypothetical protein